MRIKAKTLVYGDNVNTDVIIPARYLNTSDKKELSLHCMEDIDPDFQEKAKAGDVIAAGKNFGCGSSREHAPIALKAFGISCVIAVSFSRIFYRNAINIGLPILECADIAKVDCGDILEVDFVSGKIFNHTKNEEYSANEFPPFMQKIIEKNGLVGYLKDGAI